MVRTFTITGFVTGVNADQFDFVLPNLDGANNYLLGIALETTFYLDATAQYQNPVTWLTIGTDATNTAPFADQVKIGSTPGGVYDVGKALYVSNVKNWRGNFLLPKTTLWANLFSAATPGVADILTYNIVLSVLQSELQ